MSKDDNVKNMMLVNYLSNITKNIFYDFFTFRINAEK